MPPYLALAAYVIALGIILATLSYQREPLGAKPYLHGVVAGLELIALGWPLLVLHRRALGREQQIIGTQPELAARTPPRLLVLTAFVHWVFSVAVSLCVALPTRVLLPVVEHIRRAAPEFETAIWSAVVLLVLTAAQFLLAGVLLSLGWFGSTLLLIGVRLRRWRDLGRAIAVGMAGAAGASVLFLSADDPLLWLKPPLTLGIAWFGGVLVAGGAVLFFASRIARSLSRLTAALVLLIFLAVQAVWVEFATAALPRGLLAPEVLMVTEVGLRRDGGVDIAFREALLRTGLDALGERFVIHPQATPGPYLSSREFAPDGTVRIAYFSRMASDRARALLIYQMSASLLSLRYGVIYSPYRVGFAHWAARDPGSPFLPGGESGVLATRSCARLPDVDFAAPLDEWIDLAGLPFILAEREGGPRAAQHLLYDLIRRPDSDASWPARLLDACAKFLPLVPDSRAGELIIEAGYSGGTGWTERLASDGTAQRLFDETKRRTGMRLPNDKVIVIHYAGAGGLTDSNSHSEFYGSGKVIVTVNAGQDSRVRRDALVHQFAGILVTFGHGAVEPVRSGFASWAARSADNPFFPGSQAKAADSPDAVCAKLATTELSGRTKGDVWLSSVPFVLAERDGGEVAAQRLLHEVLSSPFDGGAWHTRVAAACAGIAGR